MGYGRYCDQLESDPPNVVQRWSPVMFNFFLELETHGKDFRRVRLKRMLVHLVALMRLLEPSSVEAYLQEAAAKLETEVTAAMPGWG